MPKWLPSTFSAMPSKATGTTPSLQDNKDRPDAIITHQLQRGTSVPSCGNRISADQPEPARLLALAHLRGTAVNRNGRVTVAGERSSPLSIPRRSGYI